MGSEGIFSKWISSNETLLIYSILGAVGGICALANILGQECCDLATLCTEGRLEEARELQLKLIAPNQAVRTSILFDSL